MSNRDGYANASAVYLDDGGRDAPGTSAKAISAHATNAISPIPDALYIGTGGDITMRGEDDATDVLWPAVPSGTILPFGPQYIRVSGTTASGFVGIYNRSV